MAQDHIIYCLCSTHNVTSCNVILSHVMCCHVILYRRAINQDKTVYKESFEKLRVLKPEIEHITKVRTAV